MRKIALALLFALLLPTFAGAQNQVPLPANSVWGRLGIPGTGGPGQAIPFANLLANLKGVAWGGKARMIPHVGQTTAPGDCYSLTDPYGDTIASSTCAAGTSTTQGLQEFLIATTSNGWPAEVDCQGTLFPSHTEPVLIEATTSVTVPVSQDWSFHSYGCNLNFNVTTVPGLIFDSQAASIFDWDGKIVYNVTAPNGNVTINPSAVVYLAPTTSTADGFPGIYGGLIRIKSPVANPIGGTMTCVICVNATGGSVIEGRLDFTEVNANNVTDYGMFVFGATPSNGLQQTEININQIHGALIAGLNVGFNQTNQANYNGNQWKINNIENAATTSRGIDVYSIGDTFDIGVINGAQGGLGVGIVSDTGSSYNKFTYGSITGYTTNTWVDAGTCDKFSGGQGVGGSTAGTQEVFVGSSSGCTEVIGSAAASGVLTLPAATDQLVGRATTDTLTNKGLTSATDSVGGVTAAFGSDAKGDLYTNSGTSNIIQRVGIGAAGTLLQPSSGLPAWTANPTLGVQQTTQGSLVLANTAAGAFPATIKSSNSATAATTYTLPTAPPVGNGYSLTATTAGVMSWTSISGGGGTPCTTTAISVQYNAAGSFGCIAGVTSNGTAMTFATSDLIINGGTATAGLATVTTGGIVSSEANATVAQGGTGGATASGTLLDNITGFSSTGLMDRTGAGTYTFTAPGTGILTALGVNVGTAGAPVINGGALGSPSSAGTIPAFTLSGTVAGGGNQINNAIIGTSTPLAGFFTALSATTSETSPIVYGGSSAGSTLALTSTSSGSPSGDKITLTAGGAMRGTMLSSGFLGLGTETNPQASLVLSGNVTTGLTFASGTQLGLVAADGSGTTFDVDSYNNGTSTSGGAFAFRTARGTGASPANLVSGDLMGAISGRGYINGNFTNAPARMAFTYNDTSPNLGTYVEFDTTAAGSTSRNQAVRLMAGAVIGTGATDPGLGNLQASGWVGTGAVAIASLPSCTASLLGARYIVNNGQTTPLFMGAVSTTGAVVAPVFCNGSGWIYG